MIGINKITALPELYYFESELPGIIEMIDEDITMFRRDPIVFDKDYFGVFFIDSILGYRGNIKHLEN